jgi:hypothetical protein
MEVINYGPFVILINRIHYEEFGEFETAEEASDFIENNSNAIHEAILGKIDNHIISNNIEYELEDLDELMKTVMYEEFRGGIEIVRKYSLD